jgi:hypothetical protein
MGIKYLNKTCHIDFLLCQTKECDMHYAVNDWCMQEETKLPRCVCHSVVLSNLFFKTCGFSQPCDF